MQEVGCPGRGALRGGPAPKDGGPDPEAAADGPIGSTEAGNPGPDRSPRHTRVSSPRARRALGGPAARERGPGDLTQALRKRPSHVAANSLNNLAEL